MELIIMMHFQENLPLEQKPQEAGEKGSEYQGRKLVRGSRIDKSFESIDHARLLRQRFDQSITVKISYQRTSR